MSYSTTIFDELNQPIVIHVTEDESKEAIANDYHELMRKYSPEYVKIERMRAQPGEEMHLKLTVMAPTHYLTSQDDREPKECDSMTAEMIVYLGYPIKGVYVSYASDHYLASPNVFRNGAACIDKWIPFKSSILTVADKVINDIIHNPVVTKYGSPANSYMIEWHREGVKAGAFPTIIPKLLEVLRIPPMPVRRSKVRVAAAGLPTKSR